MEGADFLERVRERIMADVVQECRRPDDRLLLLADRDRMLGLAKQCQRASREMMRAESVLKARMRCAGINEVGPAKLANVTQTLKDFGIDEFERQLVDADVVPDGVAQNLEPRRPLIAWGPR